MPAQLDIELTIRKRLATNSTQWHALIDECTEAKRVAWKAIRSAQAAGDISPATANALCTEVARAVNNYQDTRVMAWDAEEKLLKRLLNEEVTP